MCPRVESAPAENADDLLPLLDEELNRLPPRYRAALVACELEGKSRQRPPQQLGLPEGTLSTHLAAGAEAAARAIAPARRQPGRRADRGPVARPIAEAAVPERLMDSDGPGRLGYVSGRRSGRDSPGGGRERWRKGCSR